MITEDLHPDDDAGLFNIPENHFTQDWQFEKIIKGLVTVYKRSDQWSSRSVEVNFHNGATGSFPATDLPDNQLRTMQQLVVKVEEMTERFCDGDGATARDRRLEHRILQSSRQTSN